MILFLDSYHFQEGKEPTVETVGLDFIEAVRLAYIVVHEGVVIKTRYNDRETLEKLNKFRNVNYILYP